MSEIWTFMDTSSADVFHTGGIVKKVPPYLLVQAPQCGIPTSGSGKRNTPLCQLLQVTRLFLCLAVLLTACRAPADPVKFTTVLPAPLRPVAKIGLLAPFEGLHRRSGYEALAAMRLALDAYQGEDVAIIPLAVHLDASDLENGSAIRTVQKMVLDNELDAIVGPYDPALLQLVQSVLADQEIAWFLPFALDIEQENATKVFAANETHDRWVGPLVHEVAKQAATMGVQRLLVGGLPTDWSPEDWLSAELLSVSVQPLSAGLSEPITNNDALLWLGAPETGVTFLREHQGAQSLRAVWFGPMGGDPVLPELLLPDFTFDSTDLRWVTWLDVDYQEEIGIVDLTDDSPPHSLSPTAYLTYRATEAAIAAIDHKYQADPAYEPSASQWQIVQFVLQIDGVSRLLVGSPKLLQLQDALAIEKTR